MRGWFTSEKGLIDPCLFAPDRSMSRLKLGVVVFADDTYNWIKRNLEDIVPSGRRSLAGLEESFHTRKGLGVFRVTFGAPASVMALEIIIAGGLRKFVVLGEAGSIHPSLSPGGFVSACVRHKGGRNKLPLSGSRKGP